MCKWAVERLQRWFAQAQVHGHIDVATARTLVEACRCGRDACMNGSADIIERMFKDPRRAFHIQRKHPYPSFDAKQVRDLITTCPSLDLTPETVALSCPALAAHELWTKLRDPAQDVDEVAAVLWRVAEEARIHNKSDLVRAYTSRGLPMPRPDDTQIKFADNVHTWWTTIMDVL